MPRPRVEGLEAARVLEGAVTREEQRRHAAHAAPGDLGDRKVQRRNRDAPALEGREATGAVSVVVRDRRRRSTVGESARRPRRGWPRSACRSRRCRPARGRALSPRRARSKESPSRRSSGGRTGSAPSPRSRPHPRRWSLRPAWSAAPASRRTAAGTDGGTPHATTAEANVDANSAGPSMTATVTQARVHGLAPGCTLRGRRRSPWRT